VSDGVIVSKGNIVSTRQRQAGIARGTKPARGMSQIGNAREFLNDLKGRDAIQGSIVDDDDLKRRRCKPSQGRKAFLQKFRPFSRTNDYRCLSAGTRCGLTGWRYPLERTI
jgi:hypothetical protein